MASSNYIKNVAIVGAGGNSGSHMTKSLLETGKHTVTAITRPDSKSSLPDGVQIKKVDYEDHSSLVDALRGQDALIITMNVFAGDEQQNKLLEAAADADVPWVLPNEWSPDTAHEGLVKDVVPFFKQPQIREKIKQLGKSSYIAVTCGFWYEWSLAITPAYGFNFNNKKVTFFDDGETLTSMSTWPQVGRAVAALLSLPIQPEGGDKDRCLERFKNGHAYVNSFTISQKDMLDSVLRVTGDKREDWTITNENAQERYTKGVEDMKKGDQAGFAKQMYTRVFYKDDSGNFEKTKGTVNEMLGLPKENIDEATERAIERAKHPQW